MKKLLIVLFAAFFVFGAAGNASAAFTSGEIVQYIYEGTTDAGYEFATGLFNVGTPANPTALPADGTRITAGQPAVNLNDFTTAAWGELYAGFVSQTSSTEQVGAMPFMKDTTIDVYFATKTSTLPSVDTGAFALFSGNAAGLITSTGPGAKLKAEPVSYWEKIELQSGSGNVQGNYTGFNNNPSDGFVSLADLADGIGSYVDMYLWQYRKYDGYLNPDVEGFVVGDNSDYVAQLRIGLQDDGTGAAQLYTEVINPVPVPAAVWLLGSGLLGLVGIRRRNA